MAFVMPLRLEAGAYAEYLVLPAEQERQPADASHAESATLPMNGLTARLAVEARPAQLAD